MEDESLERSIQRIKRAASTKQPKLIALLEKMFDVYSLYRAGIKEL